MLRSNFTKLIETFAPPARSQHRAQVRVQQFLETYHALNGAFCLCDGLEIIAANAAFMKLFHLNAKQIKSTLLDQLLGDQKFTEVLFSYPEKTLEIERARGTNQTPLHLAVTLHGAGKNSSHAILEFEDRSEPERLRQRLRQERSIDPQSGALRSSAFAEAFQQQIAAFQKDGRLGMSVRLKLTSPRRDESAFTSRDRGDLMGRLTSHLKEEFGNECLVGRADTLTLDLFMEIGEDADEPDHITAQIGRIVRKLIRPLATHLEIQCGASLFPNHGETVEILTKKTILASENTKENIYTKSMSEAADRVSALKDALPQALKSGEIAPHFQPVINAADNVLIGFEALVRWQHPTIGRVIPPHIIEMATEIGLLHELTISILDHAIAQAHQWPASVHVAINVTPSQLNTELVDLVRSRVRKFQIDPSRLEIEVTEEALIDDFSASADIISRLRAIGVSVAMDDFGAGYTSIGNLRQLAFSKIKIDKSISDGLPNDPKTIAIVRSLMIMANELEVDVTVEGIETEDQLEFLRTFQCGIQGYVFSPPLPPENLSSLRPFLHPSDRHKMPDNVLALTKKKTIKKKAASR